MKTIQEIQAIRTINETLDWLDGLVATQESTGKFVHGHARDCRMEANMIRKDLTETQG